MSKKLCSGLLLIAFTLTFAVPSALFSFPHKVQAEGGGALSCVTGLAAGLISKAKTEAVGATEKVAGVPVSAASVSEATGDTALSSSVSSGTTLGSCIQSVILIPLAKAAIRRIIQSMTASIVNSINGANGTGQASFVQNVPQNLQRVGDTKVIAFVNKIASHTNSPFASVIASAVTMHYAQGSSLAGFFAANECSLTAAINKGGLGLSTAQVHSFVTGDFRQGGWNTWLGLTTRPENNPYQLAATIQYQSDDQVQTAQTQRVHEITANSGFLSFCEADDTGATSCPLPDGTTGVLTAGGTCVTNDNVDAETGLQNCSFTNAQGVLQPGIMSEGGTCVARDDTNQAALQVGDPCTKKDGSTGTIQTPGSAIKGQLDKALGSGYDQLINANDIDDALGSIMSALATQVLTRAAGGLFGASHQPAPTYTSPFLAQLGTTGATQTTTGTGTTGNQPTFTDQLGGFASSNSAATGASASFAEEKLAQIAIYDTSWNTVRASANTASTTLLSLFPICRQAAATSASYQAPDFEGNASFNPNFAITSAQHALDTEIAPLQAESLRSLTESATTADFAHKVQAEAPHSAESTPQSNELNADLQKLTTLPPLLTDIVSAQKSAQVTGQAKTLEQIANDFHQTVTDNNPFDVAQGSTVDQMNLITASVPDVIQKYCTTERKTRNQFGGFGG